jgi:hypothetical protein
MRLLNLSVIAYILIAVLLTAAVGYLIGYLTPRESFVDQPEIGMGLVIVSAIAIMMTLLFILAAGFTSMKLNDPKQPLGLPEGSIRAMIALILIMVFIIFGIHLFRVVGGGYYGQVITNQTWADLAKYAGRPTYIQPSQNSTDHFDVWIQSDISADGARLAQQLITTVGTLVVAVAGFYFGSTAVTSAVAAGQGAVAASQPEIERVVPEEGKKGEDINLKLSGKDFRSPRAVRLVRGQEQMSAEEILSSATQIQCKIMIDKEPDGKWDVIVENEDGKQARLPGAFTINTA